MSHVLKKFDKFSPYFLAIIILIGKDRNMFSINDAFERLAQLKTEMGDVDVSFDDMIKHINEAIVSVRIRKFIINMNEEWHTKMSTESKEFDFEIYGYDMFMNMIFCIEKALNSPTHNTPNEINRLTTVLLTELTSYPQDEFDFSDKCPYYYSVIVPSIYQLSLNVMSQCDNP